MSARLIDWGSYLGPSGEINLPWKELIEQGEVEGIIVRGCQEDKGQNISALENIRAARDWGRVVGCYYWNYPGQSAQYQIDTYSRSIEKEKPDFIAVDIEDYKVNGIEKDPWRLSENARCVCEGLAQRWAPLRLLPYTSNNFVRSHAAPMAEWLPKFGDAAWVASWPDYGSKVYRLEWEQIRAGDFLHPTGVWQKISDWNPSYPPGWNRWRIWQYSSRIKLPASYIGTVYDHQYDWNLYNGTPAELKAWLGLGPEQPSIESRLGQLEEWAKTLGYQPENGDGA